MNSRKTQPKPNATPDPVQHTDGQPRFVGVDFHKKVATFHVLFQDGTSLKSGSFDVDPDSIRGFAAKHLRPTDQLAVEVTSNTWAFVRLVRPYVANVVVSNPLKTKAIAEANVKTDKVDARVLADLLHCNYLPSVWAPHSGRRGQTSYSRSANSPCPRAYQYSQPHSLGARAPTRRRYRGRSFLGQGTQGRAELLPPFTLSTPRSGTKTVPTQSVGTRI